MGKNKKSTVVFFDEFKNENIDVDSTEEWQFYAWIIEAKKLGIVLDYEYQPKAFDLTEKFTYIPLFNNPKQKEKHLLSAHIYTADFKITFNYEFGEILSKAFKISKECLDENGNIVVFIDVKGGFNRFAGDRNFSIHQKLVWQKYKIFVNKIIPKEFFNDLGCPKICRFTIKTKKISHLFDGCKYIENIFNIKNQQCLLNNQDSA